MGRLYRFAISSRSINKENCTFLVCRTKMARLVRRDTLRRYVPTLETIDVELFQRDFAPSERGGFKVLRPRFQSGMWRDFHFDQTNEVIPLPSLPPLFLPPSLPLSLHRRHFKSSSSATRHVRKSRRRGRNKKPGGGRKEGRKEGRGRKRIVRFHAS